MLTTDGFGEQLCAERKKQGLTQEALAKSVGISVQTLSQIENGRKSSSLENAIKIANTLDVSLDYLCGGRETEQLQPPRLKMETLADLQMLLDLLCENLDFCEVCVDEDEEESDDIFLRLRDVPQLRDYYRDYKNAYTVLHRPSIPNSDRIFEEWKAGRSAMLRTTALVDHDLPF